VNVSGVEVDVPVPSNLVALPELVEQAIHIRLRIGVQRKAERASRRLRLRCVVQAEVAKDCRFSEASTHRVLEDCI
jgi:hypothetical protein